VFLLPLLIPRLVLATRRFWFAFWLGSLIVMNQGRVTGIEVQLGHYGPYFFGSFAVIYVLDLLLGFFNLLAPFAPRPLAQFASRLLPALAFAVIIGGFLFTVLRNYSDARAQLVFNQQDTNLRQLTLFLNNLPQGSAMFATDSYLANVLPAYVSLPSTLPLYFDPMTNQQMNALQDASAQLVGYGNWKAFQNNRPGPASPASTTIFKFDPQHIVVIINRHHPNPKTPKFAQVLLTNDDFQVGYWQAP
jgi:hypothetical protein